MEMAHALRSRRSDLGSVALSRVAYRDGAGPMSVPGRCAGRVPASRVGRALDAAALEWIRFDGRAHSSRRPRRHERRGQGEPRTAPTNNNPLSLFNLVNDPTDFLNQRCLRLHDWFEHRHFA